MEQKSTVNTYCGIIMVLITLLATSCNQSLNIRKISQTNDLFCMPLEINGQFRNTLNEEIPDYIRQLSLKIEKEANLGNNASQIFYTQTWDGGNGVYSATIIIFDKRSFQAFEVEYGFKERKIQIGTILKSSLNEKKKARIKHLFTALEKNGPWTLSIDCDSCTTEQFLTFYLQKKDQYLYYFDFNNYHFTTNPALNIDQEVIELVHLVEQIY